MASDIRHSSPFSTSRTSNMSVRLETSSPADAITKQHGRQHRRPPTTASEQRTSLLALSSEQSHADGRHLPMSPRANGR